MLSGEALRQLRALKGLKQSTIAKKLGITQQAYSKLEKKERFKEGEIIELLKVLGYNPNDLEDLKRFFHLL